MYFWHCPEQSIRKNSETKKHPNCPQSLAGQILGRGCPHCNWMLLSLHTSWSSKTSSLLGEDPSNAFLSHILSNMQSDLPGWVRIFSKWFVFCLHDIITKYYLNKSTYFLELPLYASICYQILCMVAMKVHSFTDLPIESCQLSLILVLWAYLLKWIQKLVLI